MNDIELIYINFREHAFLKGLEINFSQEMGFKLKENNMLDIFKINSKNIFEDNIANFNVIVGKNGVGKTTIINSIYNSLHGSVTKELLIILRKKHKIILYCQDDNITVNDEAARELFTNYSFKIQKKGFILDIVSISARKQDYTQEATSVAYISDFIDSSIDSSSHRYENNLGLNYSPTALINSPDSYLHYSKAINNKLKPNMENFKIISTIHQIQFIEKFSNFFNFAIPDSIEISFFYLLDSYDRTNGGNMSKSIKKIIDRSHNNKWKGIFDLHLLLAINNIVDLSQYAIYTEKSKKYKELKNKSDIEINEIRKKIVDIFNSKVKKLLDLFAEDNKSIGELEKELINIIKTTGITKFYCNIEDEELSIIQDIKDVIHAYNELINMKQYDFNESKDKITLDLKNTSTFLRIYLILRNRTNYRFIPKSIKYIKNGEEFYFSSGEDNLVRIFTYMNLAIMNLRKISEIDEISLIFLIDEPNNKMHPEMQKQFIKLVNDFLNLDEFRKCRFHIIMTTHSPIVTSDLTSNHVIFLKEYVKSGKKSIVSLSNRQKPKTFAQNIYNLYKESFFVEDGLIGTFSDSILSKIYKQISNKQDYLYEMGNRFTSNEIKFFINEIGEPLIKQQFMTRFESENKIRLLKEIKENSELKSDIKEQIINLILQNRRDNDDSN